MAFCFTHTIFLAIIATTKLFIFSLYLANSFPFPTFI